MKIETSTVPDGCLSMYWLCQAGFAFKSSSGQTVYVDPYLSDVVEKVIGFKRMSLSPITPENVVADVVVCTHEHLDHLDVDALSIIARSSRKTHFVGPVECMKRFATMGIPNDRRHLLEEGETVEVGGCGITGVYADHGTLASDALGVVLDLGGVRVYHTGDTAYRPKEFGPAIAMRPHILLPCINGAFGNMDADEAAQLTSLVGPEVVLPTHFWMFVEQNGDPQRFLKLCSELAPSTKAILLTPGEEFLFRKSQ